VSLPAGKPMGTFSTLPTCPSALSLSMTGVDAFSIGVIFPSCGTGLSAMPSPITRIYFTEYLPPSFFPTKTNVFFYYTYLYVFFQDRISLKSPIE
jgi:hypothetical protein